MSTATRAPLSVRRQAVRRKYELGGIMCLTPVEANVYVEEELERERVANFDHSSAKAQKLLSAQASVQRIINVQDFAKTVRQEMMDKLKNGTYSTGDEAIAALKQKMVDYKRTLGVQSVEYLAVEQTHRDLIKLLGRGG